ncbi:hypothetical protein Acr_25g0001920 [Actinidia rufa]|uniref:Uncharacterized protein n=1 Tax=Actinidia rufa TaxID=165716 RepID=A0A7J0GY86_9ERIC|nr:hypothetical protein Acr_25g0001920 [Actinidia rufa]
MILKLAEDVRSPLEKKTNIMTQEELNDLAGSCLFPARVQTRLPEASKTIMSVHSCKVAFYEATFSADDWEFAHGLSWKLRVLRLWSTLDRICNKAPSLNKVKKERLDAIVKGLNTGKFYSVKNILISKTFFKYFSPAPQLMASSGGENCKREENVGDVTHVRADEGESCHFEMNLRWNM